MGRKYTEAPHTFHIEYGLCINFILALFEGQTCSSRRCTNVSFGKCRLLQLWKMIFCYRFFKPGLHNIRPAGHMRPVRSFLPARENSVAENVAKARLRIITCPFRISSTLRRNRLLRPAASLCWSICPFELSELCRPALGDSLPHPCLFWIH